MDMKKVCACLTVTCLCVGVLTALKIRQDRMIALEEAERAAATEALADALAEEMATDDVAL